jgi:hypothetical protein
MNTSNTFPNSMYAPYGTNDNNFNRNAFPSNVFPPNGGMSGNPTGRYNPMTTNTQYLMNNHPSMSNFNKAYMSNDPIIEKMDYTNKNKLLHNNVGDTILDEHVVEYRIIIDSTDRDIKEYPDPFSYIVKFNPAGNQSIQTEEYIDYKKKNKGTKIVESRFAGAPTPHILKEFKNVKYIKLENVILPQYSKTRQKPDGTYEFDPSSNLPSDRFVSLEIKELDCDRVYTTSENVTRYDDNGNSYNPPTPFSMLIADKLLGLTAYTAIPFYGSKIFKNSTLGNISQLSLDFYDSSGIPLKFNNLFTYDELQAYEYENGEPLPKTDLRHPLNKKIQTNISFIVGVVESQINTNTKFDN